MSVITRFTSLVGITALLGASTALLVAAPAHADVERQGACGAGHYELTVDREGTGWDVDADLDRLATGAEWKIVLKHDGKRFYRAVRTADHEGEIDVDRFRGDTAGSDVFTFKATRVGGTERCTARITVG